MGCCNGRGTKKVENHWFSATVSNAEQRQEQSFRTVPRTTPERKGSHLARKFACSCFIYCLCDDSLYVYLNQKILRVYVLEKVKTILYLILVIHQQWLMKSIIVKNGRILAKFTKGA